MTPTQLLDVLQLGEDQSVEFTSAVDDLLHTSRRRSSEVMR